MKIYLDPGLRQWEEHDYAKAVCLQMDNGAKFEIQYVVNPQGREGIKVTTTPKIGTGRIEIQPVASNQIVIFTEEWKEQ